MKKVYTTVPLCSTSRVHHLNHNEHNMTHTDKGASSTSGAYMDPKTNKPHTMTTANFSAHNRQGELEVSLQNGMNEFWESCKDGVKISSGELYNNVGPCNKSTHLHLSYTPKNSDKILSNITNTTTTAATITTTTTNDNNILIHNNNMSKPSSNLGRTTWNYCSINMQEKENVHLENMISSVNSKTKSGDISLCNSFARVDHVYESKGNNLCHFSCSKETNKENEDKNEYPVNVQILKKNWNVLECVQNPSSFRKDTVNFKEDTCHKNVISNKQQTYLHNDLPTPQTIPECNSSDIHSPWKPESQLLFNQRSCNQVCHGSSPASTLQKRDLQNMQCHEQFSNDVSENGKIIRIHSFRLNTDPVKSSTLPCNTTGYSSVSRSSTFTNNDSTKRYSENDGNQLKICDMEQSHDVETKINKTKDVIRLLPFSVVRKKLKWPCSFCGASQATRLSLITHIKSHLLPWCKICLKVMNSKDQLINHMEKKHSSSDVEIDQPDTQFVTSKYGRRRRVYSPATLLPKRKCDMKK